MPTKIFKGATARFRSIDLAWATLIAAWSTPNPLVDVSTCLTGPPLAVTLCFWLFVHTLFKHGDEQGEVSY
jgi:hypothetical protein